MAVARSSLGGNGRESRPVIAAFRGPSAVGGACTGPSSLAGE